MEPLLRVSNLSKSFGTLPVIRNVSFEVNPGEVVGLTGSIGSGKSVLVMLLAGLYPANTGSIYFKNKLINWPFKAQSLGIGVIHQKPTLIDQFDVVSNIFLGNEIGDPSGLGMFRTLNTNQMYHEAERILTKLGVQVSSLEEKVANLSGEQRQMIAIARALTCPASMVIIDEPTVLLSYAYQQRLLDLIQDWRSKGVSVLFSDNNLDHLFAVTDRLVILHQGYKVADLRTDETNRETVINLLLGTGKMQKPIPNYWILTATTVSGKMPKDCSITRLCWERTWPKSRCLTARSLKNWPNRYRPCTRPTWYCWKPSADFYRTAKTTANILHVRSMTRLFRTF